MKLQSIGSAINNLAKVSPKLAARIAIELFTRPRRIAMSAQVEAYLTDAEQLKIKWHKRELKGYHFASTRNFATQRVLLVHGWESHSGRWVPLIKLLRAAGCEVVTFDGPAAGKSQGKRTPFNLYVDAIQSVERAYGPFDAYVGHSLGGGVVAQMISRLPNERKPSKAVVMAAFDESEHVFDRYHAMLQLDANVRKAFDRKIVRTLSGKVGEQNVRDYSNTLALSRCGDVEGLVIHSVNDKVSPFAEGLALRDAWPNAKLLQFEHEGHALTGKGVLLGIAEFLRD